MLPKALHDKSWLRRCRQQMLLWSAVNARWRFHANVYLAFSIEYFRSCVLKHKVILEFMMYAQNDPESFSESVVLLNATCNATESRAVKKCGRKKKSWNRAIFIRKINFTIDFGHTAAEIDWIVKLEINFTMDFKPTAAEIEQIVKLIENIKRNIFSSFIFSINFTIYSISAALGPKAIVKLIFNFTISSIFAAVCPKSIVQLIFMLYFDMFAKRCIENLWTYAFVWFWDGRSWRKLVGWGLLSTKASALT